MALYDNYGCGYGHDYDYSTTWFYNENYKNIKEKYVIRRICIQGQLRIINLLLINKNEKWSPNGVCYRFDMKSHCTYYTSNFIKYHIMKKRKIALSYFIRNAIIMNIYLLYIIWFQS